MSLKHYNPTSSGIRGRITTKRDQLWKGSPFKALVEGMSNTGGRNAQGRMTSRHRVSKYRKAYRKVSFDRRDLDKVAAQVVRLEYDPNRTAHIALLKYKKENKDVHAYIIAPKNLKVGDTVLTSYNGKTEYNPGNCMRLGDIKDGTFVHCVELKIGKGASIARSAGSYAQILGSDEKGRVILKLSSGELKAVNKNCTACVGVVSNDKHTNAVIGKAGGSFWKGVRPKVRGIAMNPVDHPNGGRANGGTHFASPTGVYAKGLKTRRNKRTSHTIIKGRKKK